MTLVGAAGLTALCVAAACLVLYAAWRASPSRGARGARSTTGPTRADGGERTNTNGPPEPDGGEPADSGYLLGTSESHKRGGVTRWLTTVDHKDIGLLYLAFAAVAFLWGGTDAMMMRTELYDPAVSVWDEHTYNALFTMHGLTMLFLFGTPALAGLGNYLLPLLIGADDMAFPRINAIAFWLLVPALVLMRAGLLSDVLGHVFVAGGLGALGEQLLALAPPATGWTFYTPLSVQIDLPTVSVVLLGLHLSGVATTMSAINFIATIFTEREVSWKNLDIFSWTMLTQSGLILFAFPLLGSALVMLLLDRNLGTTFFALEGGSPILWQHLFWFFGHPEVYILVLPPMGIVSLLIPKFAGRKLFGFKFVVYSTLAIGVLSFGVWAHHMFTTGIDPRLRASFMAVSIAIAVPSAVKVFNWITTMWNGRVRLAAPMLFCVGGVGTFIVGGVTGIFLAAIPVDLLLHDTYYVVGHFHFIIMGLISFAFFAATYYWYPLVVGKHPNHALAVAHFVLTTAGIVLAFGPMMIMGQEGLPRRYAAYPAEFAGLQQVATLGAVLIALGTVVWLFNLVQSYRMGDPVTTDDPWDLRERGDQRTAEWDELPYSRD
ncbi:cbb3-type cytochrome c oxidase subunit I [Halobacterium sp. R2-5]|uniref:cbb3-type cytochrome c oxidase subunit I n=1 Tax=Halobacterium sp. R2-5 TaxID=2715751 RepID=UPI001422D51F|nr:cbb3-type cytochrome c oxidase subunit I [Halobacterium sp. R2-5]NIB99648.1 cytochrome-c oxidase [Halobacterium sp. R2-5]